MTNWAHRYLDLAKHISTWSKDPSTKIGAVCIGDSGQILAQGYNGFPRGVADTEERLNNREEKYEHVVHAEENCIFNACLNGVSLKGCSLYVFGLPICSNCTNGIIQVGIKTVYMAHPSLLPETWEKSWSRSQMKLEEAHIDYVRYAYDEREHWLDTVWTREIRRHKSSEYGREIHRSYCGPESEYQDHILEQHLRQTKHMD